MKYNPNNKATWPVRQGGDDRDPMPYAKHLRETSPSGTHYDSRWSLDEPSHSHMPLWTAIACLFGMMLPLWVVAIRIMEGRS